MEIVKDTDGKSYAKLGNKLVPVEFDATGKPTVVGMWAEEKTYPDGRKDCTMHVPCFQIAGTQHKPT